MDLHILSLAKLIDHTPQKPTYLLSIISTRDEQDSSSTSLVKYLERFATDSAYTRRHIVGIDDVWNQQLPSGTPLFTRGEIEADIPQYNGMMGNYIDRNTRLFDEETAKKLLTHFRDNYRQAESFVVNCTRGRNRSPAVAIALNELYNLGYATNTLKAKYREANWYVYKMLLETAANNPDLVR